MARLGRTIASDDSIIRGLILDSRDVFSRERYEQRINYKLAVLTQQFHKNKTVDKGQVQKVVKEFMRDVTLILRELEDAKRRAEQEEARKIDKIRQLLIGGTKIHSKKFKKELEKFGEDLKSNTVSGLRSYRRRERRLRRGKAPIGYFLKKVRQDKALERDIVRKASDVVEDTSREHKLSSEVAYLIKAINAGAGGRILPQLEERIKLLVKNYEKDLEDFLNIEIDIEIEEARKLHRIDHYIAFLKMAGGFNNLINELNELKKKVEYWVYQDSIDAKKLVMYAKTLNYGLSMLKSSEATEDEHFPGITIRPLHLIEKKVPGLLIVKENLINKTGGFLTNKGIILVHSLAGTKEALTILGKRLASLDYVVYSIDTASHGESKDMWSMSINCEYIQAAVKWLRSQSVKNVGIIGHSLGTIFVLFALWGYNREIEEQFYNNAADIKKRFTNVCKDLDKVEDLDRLKQSNQRAYNKIINNLFLISRDYIELKKAILNSLKKMYESNSKIDAAVLLSAPKTTQMFFPPQLSFVIKHLPKVVTKSGARKLGKLITQGFFNKVRKQEGKRAILPEYIDEKNKTQIVGAAFSDLYYAFDYAQKSKNPFDYLELITYLCDNIKGPNFIKYYRDFIRYKIPKLFIYGLADKNIIRGFWKQFLPINEANILELEKYYKNIGETEIVRIPDVMHQLNKEGKDLQFEAGKLPKLTYKIVTFLNRYLGRGRLL